MAKRISKKEIYRSYGIEFNGDKVLSPIGWINPLLINGNEKIGKGVWHFSTLPTANYFTVIINGQEMTIKGTCPCTCRGCYATKGNYQYDSVVTSLAIKTLLVREHLDFVKRAILAQIQADKIQFLRIHASGDFDSLEYIQMWIEIVAACQDVHFWTYTKSPAAENIFDNFDNANIVKSVIPHIGVNYGHCDYILAAYETLKAAGLPVYICRCGIDKNQHCTNCKGCSVNRYVLFIEHSTEYKAEKDPLFPVLKAVIESQPLPV